MNNAELAEAMEKMYREFLENLPPYLEMAETIKVGEKVLSKEEAEIVTNALNMHESGCKQHLATDERVLKTHNLRIASKDEFRKRIKRRKERLAEVIRLQGVFREASK